jgi:hypothetical protein
MKGFVASYLWQQIARGRCISGNNNVLSIVDRPESTLSPNPESFEPFSVIPNRDERQIRSRVGNPSRMKIAAPRTPQAIQFCKEHNENLSLLPKYQQPPFARRSANETKRTIERRIHSVTQPQPLSNALPGTKLAFPTDSRTSRVSESNH